MALQNKLQINIGAKNTTGPVFATLTRSLGLVRKAIFSFRTALVGVAGAAGLGLLVKSSLDSIDTLGKTAQKLGVTSQALQKLRYASNLAGVETRTVDMAVQRFTRRLSEAANGTGEAKDALKELGLNAKELAKQPLDKQMLALADAFDDVQSSGDKVRLAFKLFDSEGVAFVNTLEGGSAALQQMFQDAEGLGFILSSSSVKGVEEANDAMMKLGVMFKGVADQITAGLAPAFRVIVDLIRDKLVKAIETAGGMQNFAKALALAVVNMAERISIAIQGFVNRIINGLNFLIDAAKALGRVIDSDTLKSIERVGTYSFVTAGFFQDLRDAINSTKDATNELTNAQNAGNETGKTYRKQLMDLADAAKDVQKNMESAAVRGIKSLEDALVDVTMGTASAKDAFKSMARSIISDLIRINIQKNITAPLAAGMGGAGGGGFVSGIGSFIGGLFGFANGGRPSMGKPAIVGEKGAELFVPDSAGRIIPNDKLGGGVTVHQTINLSAGVSQTVRAEVMGMLPQIQEASKAAVLEARRRGGSFASAFGG